MKSIDFRRLPQSSAETCEGHMMSGRKAVYAVAFQSGLRAVFCDECASDLRDELPEFPPKKAPKAIETGEGKGPDFRPLPVTPTRVRP